MLGWFNPDWRGEEEAFLAAEDATSGEARERFAYYDGFTCEQQDAMDDDEFEAMEELRDFYARQHDRYACVGADWPDVVEDLTGHRMERPW